MDMLASNILVGHSTWLVICTSLKSTHCPPFVVNTQINNQFYVRTAVKCRADYDVRLISTSMKTGEFARLYHKRNQQITVRPELVEGLNQTSLKFSQRQQKTIRWLGGTYFPTIELALISHQIARILTVMAWTYTEAILALRIEIAHTAI
jgi:hypothetical protein